MDSETVDEYLGPSDIDPGKATRLKVRFTIEVEILGLNGRKVSQETWDRLAGMNKIPENELKDLMEAVRVETDFNWEPLLLIKPEIVDEDYDENNGRSRFAKRQIDYLVEHLPDEVRALVVQMLLGESFVVDADRAASDMGIKARNHVIRTAVNECKGRIRKRLPTRTGRPKDKRRSDYPNERKAFFDRCIEALQTVERTGNRLTLANLAGEMFPDSDEKFVEDPTRTLTKKLQDFDLTWARLLKYHKGQDRDLRTFLEDELRLFARYM